jgi:hypothetical protein
MATLGISYPTLLDASKLHMEDGTAMPLAELLHQKNPAFDDIPWIEANSVTGHRLAARTGLPSSTWRKLNGGVLPTKGNYADITEGMGELAQLGKIDKTLLDIAGDKEAFRLTENAGHIEGIAQDWMTSLFYGDSSLTPEQFLGLSARFFDIGAGSPQNAENIIDAGGTGTDNASIWLVGWGPDSVYGIYPKGTKAGLVHEDYGVELTLAPDGVGELPMQRDWFKILGGIAVKDWRNIVRIANVDVSDLTKNAATGADLINLMVRAIELINNREGTNLVFYVNRTVASFLRQQIANKSNVWLSQGEVAGKHVTMFDGIPVRRVDRLTEAEARIV